MTFAMTFMHFIATCRYNTLFHNITWMSQFETCDFLQRKWTEQYVLIICTCMYIFRSRKSRLFSSVRSSATRGSFFHLFHHLFSMPFIREYLSIIIVWIKYCWCIVKFTDTSFPTANTNYPPRAHEDAWGRATKRHFQTTVAGKNLRLSSKYHPSFSLVACCPMKICVLHISFR